MGGLHRRFLPRAPFSNRRWSGSGDGGTPWLGSFKKRASKEKKKRMKKAKKQGMQESVQKSCLVVWSAVAYIRTRGSLSPVIRSSPWDEGRSSGTFSPGCFLCSSRPRASYRRAAR